MDTVIDHSDIILMREWTIDVICENEKVVQKMNFFSLGHRLGFDPVCRIVSHYLGVKIKNNSNTTFFLKHFKFCDRVSSFKTDMQ